MTWTELLPAAKDYGPFGLLALMVLLGWLVPLRTHNARVADLKEQLAQKDKTIEMVSGQRDTLQAELTKIAMDVLAAIPRQREPL